MGKSLMLMFASLIALSVSQPSSAISLFMTSDYYWFDLKDQTPVDAWIDVANLDKDAIQNFINANSEIPRDRIKLKTEKDFVRIEASGVFHRQLVVLRRLIERMKKAGGASPSILLPFAPRVLNIDQSEQSLKFAVNVSGVRREDIEALSAKEKQNGNRKMTMFKYYLDDPNWMFGDEPEYLQSLNKASGDAVMGRLKTGRVGRMPLMIDGESAVWHARDYHASCILGKFNPALVNRYLQFFLTSNKYVESLFWDQYVPETMPKTYLLENVLKDIPNKGSIKERATALVETLNHLFPEGFVLKGNAESRTANYLVTEKTDIVGKLKNYFDNQKAYDNHVKAMKEKYAGADEDMLFWALQEQGGFKNDEYFGWKLNNYITMPHTAIVQAKLPIDNEFRTDVLLGKALDETIDRFIYKGRKRADDDPTSSRAEMARGERWIQSVLNKLKKLGPLSWLYLQHGGWDYARLKGGGFGLIESNMGVESSKWYDTDTQVKKLIAYLRSLKGKSYSEISEGATPEEQIRFIKSFSKEHNLDWNKLFPGITFRKNRIDPAFQPIRVAKKYTIVPICVTAAAEE